MIRQEEMAAKPIERPAFVQVLQGMGKGKDLKNVSYN